MHGQPDHHALGRTDEQVHWIWGPQASAIQQHVRDNPQGGKGPPHSHLGPQMHVYCKRWACWIKQEQERRRRRQQWWRRRQWMIIQAPTRGEGQRFIQQRRWIETTVEHIILHNVHLVSYYYNHYFYYNTLDSIILSLELFPSTSLPIVSAKSDFVSCCCCPHPAKKNRVDTTKTSNLKLQTWATYSSYVGQVHVRVRVKVRVQTKKRKINTSWETRVSTSLLQDFLSLCTFR